MKKIILFLIAVASFHPGYSQKAASFTTDDYVRALKHATDVMVTDVASPVAASRYYAYINLAANETVALFDNQQPSLAMVVKRWNNIEINKNLIQKSDLGMAIILALYKSGAKLLPSGYLLQQKMDSFKLVAKKR